MIVRAYSTSRKHAREQGRGEQFCDSHH
jgi:hypothetical protein